MREAEAAALLLLLLGRRRAIPSLDALNDDFTRRVERLQYETERGILAIRQGAHLAGRRDMFELWPQFDGVSLYEGVNDVKRAERYSRNLALLAGDVVEKPNALAVLDNRIATIAISENAEAFNSSRRAIADDIAAQYDLIEIWDARMDACPVCWELNGTESIVGLGFPGGETPGGVHPRCQCTSHFERRYFH